MHGSGIVATCPRYACVCIGHPFTWNVRIATGATGNNLPGIRFFPIYTDQVYNKLNLCLDVGDRKMVNNWGMHVCFPVKGSRFRASAKACSWPAAVITKQIGIRTSGTTSWVYSHGISECAVSTGQWCNYTYFSHTCICA